MDLSTQLFHRLSQYQRKHNLSQNALGKLLGYSPSHFSEILNGKKLLSSTATLKALQLINEQTNVTMFLSRRKTDSVSDKIQRGINIIQDISDDAPDAPEPTNRDLDESDDDSVIETTIDEVEEGLPDDEEHYKGQESVRRKLGEKLSSRRIRK